MFAIRVGTQWLDRFGNDGPYTMARQFSDKELADTLARSCNGVVEYAAFGGIRDTLASVPRVPLSFYVGQLLRLDNMVIAALGINAAIVWLDIVREFAARVPSL